MRGPLPAQTYTSEVLVCLLAAMLVALEANPQSPSDQITNATVVELSRAGVESDTIALVVRASASNFDLSQRGLDALRNRGVADAVIAAMLRRNSDGDASIRGAVINEVSFALERHDGTGVVLAAMAAAPYTSAMSFGLFSAGTKVILPGKNARIETSDELPAFRVSLPQSRKPTDFILSKFEESDEGGARQINPESSLLFDVDALANGVYRLRPRAALRRGEYGFYVADTTSSGPQVRMTIYDFRIVRR